MEYFLFVMALFLLANYYQAFLKIKLLQLLNLFKNIMLITYRALIIV